MVPTTRSASRKTRQSSSTVYPSVKKRVESVARPKPSIKPWARRNKPGTKAVDSPPLSSPMPIAIAESYPIAKLSERPVLKWFSVESSQFKNIAELLELMDVLREIRRQPGCVSVHRQSRDEFSTPEYFTIEWHKSTDRTQFLESEASKRFVQAVQEGNLRQTQLVRLPREGSCSFHPGNPDLTCDFREVVTAYFPKNLPDTITQALDRIKGPFTTGGPMSGDELERPFNRIHEGLLGSVHGWEEGIVYHQGQPARRMIYMLKWFDELAQQQYKEEARWPKRTRDGQTILLAMDAFLDDLEDLGMLGYETRNVEFSEVYKYYWPGDPGYDNYINNLENLDRHRAS